MTYAGTLVVETCPVCGVNHGIPSNLVRVAKEKGPAKSLYCPNGHGWHYTKAQADIDRDRARIEHLERRLANRDEDLRAERAHHAATKGKLTKTKKRVAGGACPCCNRSFVDLARHMQGQHPDYAQAVTP